MSEDLILARAQRVTEREVRTEQNWLQAVLAGFPREAERIQKTGYDAEHYIAGLSEVPEQVTEVQRERLARLEAEAEAAIKEFRNAQRRRNEQEPERPERPIREE